MGCVLEVAQKVPVVNPDQEKRMKDLLAQRPKNPQEYKSIADQINDCKSKYYDIKEVPYQFPLETTKELKVRQLKLTPKEDKDGKPAKYTPDELKALKGDDPKLPGYTADAKDLSTDTLVRVYLDRTKFKPAPKLKPGEEPPDEPTAYPAAIIVILPPPEEKKPPLGK
jgi:hypothetical protein